MKNPGCAELMLTRGMGLQPTFVPLFGCCGRTSPIHLAQPWPQEAVSIVSFSQSAPDWLTASRFPLSCSQELMTNGFPEASAGMCNVPYPDVIDAAAA